MHQHGDESDKPTLSLSLFLSLRLQAWLNKAVSGNNSCGIFPDHYLTLYIFLFSLVVSFLYHSSNFSLIANMFIILRILSKNIKHIKRIFAWTRFKLVIPATGEAQPNTDKHSSRISELCSPRCATLPIRLNRGSRGTCFGATTTTKICLVLFDINTRFQFVNPRDCHLSLQPNNKTSKQESYDNGYRYS